MKENKEIKLAKKLLKILQSKNGFGKKVCKELHADCGNCKGQILIGYLNWLIDLELETQK